jgi:hypothetical protein
MKHYHAVVKEEWRVASEDVKERVTNNYHAGVAEKAKERKELEEEAAFLNDGSAVSSRAT